MLTSPYLRLALLGFPTPSRVLRQGWQYDDQLRLLRERESRKSEDPVPIDLDDVSG